MGEFVQKYIWTDDATTALFRFSQDMEDFYKGTVEQRKHLKRLSPLQYMRKSLNDILVAHDGSEPVACTSLKQYDSTSAEIKRVWLQTLVTSKFLATRHMTLWSWLSAMGSGDSGIWQADEPCFFLDRLG